MRPATLRLQLLFSACGGARTAPPDADAAGLPAMRVSSSAEPGDACLLLAPPRARASGVRLLVPDDATAGDVWRATLHVLRLGAGGVDYAPAG